MKLLRAFALCGSLASSSGVALAQVQPHGVLSGAALSYQATTNRLSIDQGNVWVDGNVLQLMPLTNNIPNTCLATMTTLGGPKAFYVYYVNVPAPNEGLYISSTAPSPDGHPQSQIQGSANLPNCNAPKTWSAIFLGSFITNSAGAVVPFWRSGDDVILGGAVPNGGGVVSFPVGATPPVCENPLPVSFPSSANAYLMDISMWDTCNASNSVTICPVFNGGFACSMFGTQNAMDSDTFAIPASTSTATQKQYRLRSEVPFTPTFCMAAYAGAACVGGNVVNIQYSYTGYVEKIAYPFFYP